jgi:hypothetical protein
MNVEAMEAAGRLSPSDACTLPMAVDRALSRIRELEHSCRGNSPSWPFWVVATLAVIEAIILIAHFS